MRLPLRMLLACIVLAAVAAASTAPASPRHVALLTRRIALDHAPVFHADAAYRNARAERLADDAVTFLVRMAGRTSPDDRAAIANELGVTFGDYLPHDTFVVHTNEANAHALLAHDAIEWVGAYHADMKVHPTVARYLRQLRERAPDTLGADAPVELEVFWVSGVDQDVTAASAVAWRAELPARFVFTTIEHADARVATVRTSTGELERVVAWLATQPHVWMVLPHLPRGQANYSASWILQSNVADAFPLWDAALTGAGQVIGVADTGLDMNNCFFFDAAHPTVGCSAHSKVIRYEKFSWSDYGDVHNGHGTHVAGIAAGKSSTLFNGVNYSGVAKDAQIAFTDLADEPTALAGGLSTPVGLGRHLFAIPYCVGARVHTNSWNCVAPEDNPTDCNLYDAQCASADEYLYENQDLAVFFSMGNAGHSGAATVAAPATGKNVVSVGAGNKDRTGAVEAARWRDYTEAGNGRTPAECCSARLTSCCEDLFTTAVGSSASQNTNTLAGYSSRGPVFDGRIKPDVVGPGTYIVSAHADGSVDTRVQCGTEQPALGNDAGVMAITGTSMATPAVAGAAALVRQYFQDGFYPTGARVTANGFDPSGPLVKAVLVNSGREVTARETNSGLSALSGINADSGFGYVTLANVLGTTGTGHVLVDQTRQMHTDDAVAYCVRASGTAPIKATLVWYDPPSNPNAATNLVNDLDLSVAAAGGGTLPVNGQAGRDAVNTVEQVTIPSPAANAAYTITVRGHNVPLGPQKYALVVSQAGGLTSCGNFPTVMVSADATPCSALAEQSCSPAAARAAAGVVGAVLALVVAVALL